MMLFARTRVLLLLMPFWALLAAGCAAPPSEVPVWETSRDIQLVPARATQAVAREKVKPPVQTAPPDALETASAGRRRTKPGNETEKAAGKPEPPVPPVPESPPLPPGKEPEPPPSSPPATAYQLRPGNPIRIDLLGIPDARTIDDVIDETGFISLMYIGAIKAAGKTAHELEREIEQTYIRQKIYKQISVNVVVQAKQYFVRGEVQRPGSFPLTAGAALSQAVAVAGGFTEFANLKKIRISRGGKTITVNFKDIEKDSRKDVPLEVGDTIVVSRSVF